MLGVRIIALLIDKKVGFSVRLVLQVRAEICFSDKMPTDNTYFETEQVAEDCCIVTGTIQQCNYFVCPSSEAMP